MVDHMFTGDLNPLPSTAQVFESDYLPERPDVSIVFKLQGDENGCLLNSFKSMGCNQQKTESECWCRVDGSGLSLLGVHNSRARCDGVNANPQRQGST